MTDIYNTGRASYELSSTAPDLKKKRRKTSKAIKPCHYPQATLKAAKLKHGNLVTYNFILIELFLIIMISPYVF